MEKPSIENTLKKAREIAFYSENYKLADFKNKNVIISFLENSRILTGEDFLDDNFYKFIPKDKANLSLFLTSGSTGKPKIIPTTYDDLNLFGYGFHLIYQEVLGEDPSIIFNIAAPRPAISGAVLSSSITHSNAIEIDQGPGQNIFDLFVYADKILGANPNLNKKILLIGFPSLLFRQIYGLDEEKRRKLREIASKNEVYALIGGEPSDIERSRLLHKFLPMKGLINFLASTERLTGYKFYPESLLNDDTLKDTYVFKLGRYGNEFGILSDGKLIYSLDDEKKGLSGDLIVTNKCFKNKIHMPLINYNTKENVKFLGIDKDYVYLEFLGRSNKLINFSVSKLNDIIADNVIASTARRFNLGEGYAELTRENGVDKLTFYFYKNAFEGSKDKVLEYLISKLSEQEMEIKYVLEKKLGLLRLELTEKDKIPFYDPKVLKSAKIVDKRGISAY